MPGEHQSSTQLAIRVQTMGYQVSRPIFRNIAEARTHYDISTDDRFALLDKLAYSDVDKLRAGQPAADIEYFGLLTQALELSHVDSRAIDYALTTSFPLFVAMHRNHPRVSFGGVVQTFAEKLINHQDDALAFAISETEAVVEFVEKRDTLTQRALAICEETLQAQAAPQLVRAMGVVGSLVRGDAYLYSDLDPFFFTDLDLTSPENQHITFETGNALAATMTLRIRAIWPQFGGIDHKEAPLDEEAGKEAVGESLWNEAHRQRTFAYKVIGIDEDSVQKTERILETFKAA